MPSRDAPINRYEMGSKPLWPIGYRMDLQSRFDPVGPICSVVGFLARCIRQANDDRQAPCRIVRSKSQSTIVGAHDLLRDRDAEAILLRRLFVIACQRLQTGIVQSGSIVTNGDQQPA